MKTKNEPRNNMTRTAHSVSENFYHLVFSTYKRQPILKISWTAEEILQEQIKSCIKQLGGRVEMIEYDACHVHILAMLPPSISLAKALKNIKGLTSRRIRQAVPGLGGKKLWSASYYTATVGSRADALIKYMAHHSHRE